MKTAAPRALSVLMAAMFVASCAPVRPCLSGCDDALPPRFQADSNAPPATVRLMPTAEWMDTGITVHKGDRLLFTATGQVCWQRRNGTTGPDGERGEPGWNVGPGGLRGRVGTEGKPFDVGARTGLFPDAHARPPHHRYPPPPITMPRDGALTLGFKNFAPGANTGWFEITVQRAVPVAQS